MTALCIQVISLRETRSMPKNRLKNTADTLCYMFCGWRQIASKNQLADLGSGRLEIDVLTGECFFEDKHISKLPIAEELQLSFQHALSVNRIRESVSRARLRVKLSFSKTTWDKRTNTE